MQPRLMRYKQFIETEFADSLLWHKDYTFDGLHSSLRKKIKQGKFRRIIFTGMGCSAIVSDVIKGFLATQKIPLYIEVINDYDINFLVDKEAFKDEGTLVIVSSYSGYSQEPMTFYENIKGFTKNIIFLTSGGKLGAIAQKGDVSIIYWRLRNPDREYPLFHVPQYFSILLDIFYELKLLPSNFEKELRATSNYLKKEFSSEKIQKAQAIAKKLRDREIVFITSPKWYFTLLKLVDMHFNEIAMAPAHRNFLHEFTHSEVATFTNPKSKLGLVVFSDTDDDPYTKGKVRMLGKMLTNKRAKQNRNIEFVEILINQKNFFAKFLETLFFMSYVAYLLGVYYDTASRELISTAAGNPWYNQKTIQMETHTNHLPQKK